jgi:hypothetical protein
VRGTNIRRNRYRCIIAFSALFPRSWTHDTGKSVPTSIVFRVVTAVDALTFAPRRLTDRNTYSDRVVAPVADQGDARDQAAQDGSKRAFGSGFTS